MPFPSGEPLRLRTNQSSTQKRFSEVTRRDKNIPLRKGVVQENFKMRGQQSPNGSRKQEQSWSETRAQPERRTGPRKNAQGPGTTSFRDCRISYHSRSLRFLKGTSALSPPLECGHVTSEVSHVSKKTAEYPSRATTWHKCRHLVQPEKLSPREALFAVHVIQTVR